MCVFGRLSKCIDNGNRIYTEVEVTDVVAIACNGLYTFVAVFGNQLLKEMNVTQMWICHGVKTVSFRPCDFHTDFILIALDEVILFTPNVTNIPHMHGIVLMFFTASLPPKKHSWMNRITHQRVEKSAI